MSVVQTQPTNNRVAGFDLNDIVGAARPCGLASDQIHFPAADLRDLTNFVQQGFALAVSYWASLEAIHAWRENARHMIAKEKGKSTWFKKYLTRIAKVERVY